MSVRDLIPWGRGGPVQPEARESAFDPLLTLHRDMNRLFDSVFRDVAGFASGNGAGGLAAWPSVDVAETETAFKVTAEIPGLEEKDVEVLLDDGVLTLRGEKRAEARDEAHRIAERFFGRFERRISIGGDIEDDKVQAEFKNGVLQVVLPKLPQARSKTKRIEIKS